MATIRQQEENLIALKQDVKAAWISACEADGIDPTSKFVVLSNTTEAANYNELTAMFLKARQAYHNQMNRNTARRARHAAYTSCGLKAVRVNGETIYE
jgi:hypothetical protein